MYSENAFRMSLGRSFRETDERLAFVTKTPHEGLAPRAQNSNLLPRQLVTLGYLSDRLPESLISEHLAKSLRAETNAEIVIVRLEPQEGGLPTDAMLNGEFHMPPEIRKASGGFHSLTLGVESRPSSPASVESLVGQLGRHFRYVLIEIPDDRRLGAWLEEFLIRSDLAFLFLPRVTEAAYRLEAVAREARNQCINGGIHVKPIVCLAEDEPVDGFDTFVQRVACPAHMFLRGCTTRLSANESAPLAAFSSSFQTDARRLAREIAGHLVGLALSSGAAKGFAHIGVIQILEENGIEVDVVAEANINTYIDTL